MSEKTSDQAPALTFQLAGAAIFIRRPPEYLEPAQGRGLKVATAAEVAYCTLCSLPNFPRPSLRP